MRHPDRPTGLRCTRCDRPACPDCLREASVGYQCVDCVNEGRQTILRPKTVAGAQLSRRLVVVFRQRMDPRPLLATIALNVFISVAVPGISLLGHLGGLVVGAIATAAMVYAPAKQRNLWQAITFVVLAVALVGLIMMRVNEFPALECDHQPVLQCRPIGG